MAMSMAYQIKSDMDVVTRGGKGRVARRQMRKGDCKILFGERLGRWTAFLL